MTDLAMTDLARPSQRQADQLRDVKITRDYTMHAEGSVLVEFGNTKVLCTASVEQGVPRFLKGIGKGWVTAEYGMLPRSTGSRMDREAARGKQGGRTQEIQRLIGRALRATVDMKRLGENTYDLLHELLVAIRYLFGCSIHADSQRGERVVGVIDGIEPKAVVTGSRLPMHADELRWL